VSTASCWPNIKTDSTPAKVGVNKMPAYDVRSTYSDQVHSELRDRKVTEPQINKFIHGQTISKGVRNERSPVFTNGCMYCGSSTFICGKKFYISQV
jgi:hypothetical protein